MLGGEEGFGFHGPTLEQLAQKVARLYHEGIHPALVLGGGNFFRGARTSLSALKRHHGDHIGMLATIMNAMCFADFLTAAGVPNQVFSAFPIPNVCAPYQIDQAFQALNDGRVCLFAGGTGNPYFSTDSAAALRAIEVGCDVLIKATKVDGIYDADPEKKPQATRFAEISYREVLERKLGVMDLNAIAMCREQNMPLLVLSLAEPDSLLRACCGEDVGTKVIEDHQGE